MKDIIFYNETHANLFFEGTPKYSEEMGGMDNDRAAALYLASLVACLEEVPLWKVYDSNILKIKLEYLDHDTRYTLTEQIMLLAYNLETGRTCYGKKQLYSISLLFSMFNVDEILPYVMEALNLLFHIFDSVVHD